MRTDYLKSLMIILALIIVGTNPAAAEDKKETGKTTVSVTAIPADYISVSGNAAKFRSQHWLNDGYTGGFEDLLINGKIDKDTTFLYQGHMLSNTNDYGGDLEIKKGERAFFNFDFDKYRKYYDGHGGVYYPSTTLSGVVPDKDLHLDIGRVGIEVGGIIGNFPELSLFFDNDTKDGVKSRLSQTAVVENGVTRMIGPSWQDINESTTDFGLRAKKEIGGFDVKGEQKWQYLRETTLRDEQSLSTNATASEHKERRQYQEVESNSSISTLRGEKWFWQDTGMVALAYRYSKIDISEDEDIREFDQFGNPTSFSNPHNNIGAIADNKTNSNIVTGHFQSQPLSNLLFSAKLKTEIMARRGGSTDPSDTTNPPNGIPNTTEVSLVQNKVDRWGGDLGLRYSGIKRTSLYGNVEVERFNNWIYENRNSIAGESAASAGEVFYRETNVYTTKYILTAGSRTVLNKFLNFTTQIRHKNEDSDYDDIREVDPTGSSDKSAFFDYLQIGGTDLTTKWTVKPLKQVTGSMRYQYGDNAYVSRTDAAVNQRSLVLSHTFTYDLMLQPIDSLLLDLGYMRQLAKTSTPAGNGASPKIPGFTANVNTWMLSSSYIISPKWSLNSSFSKADQDNFNDFTSTGMPYGVDASWYDASVGLSWIANKTVTVEPKYTYYSYKDNPKTEAGGGYTAHEVWLGVNLNWM